MKYCSLGEWQRVLSFFVNKGSLLFRISLVQLNPANTYMYDFWHCRKVNSIRPEQRTTEQIQRTWTGVFYYSSTLDLAFQENWLLGRMPPPMTCYSQIADFLVISGDSHLMVSSKRKGFSSTTLFIISFSCFEHAYGYLVRPKCFVHNASSKTWRKKFEWHRRLFGGHPGVPWELCHLVRSTPRSVGIARVDCRDVLLCHRGPSKLIFATSLVHISLWLILLFQLSQK